MQGFMYMSYLIVSMTCLVDAKGGKGGRGGAGRSKSSRSRSSSGSYSRSRSHTYTWTKPPYCPDVDQSLCAVMYDSNDCLGGWDLPIEDGEERNLYYFSSDWKYRNDVDTIGLRSGCTFHGFTSTGFSGDKMTFTANETDKWLVLDDHYYYYIFHEDIEAFQCFCGPNLGRIGLPISNHLRRNN